MDNILSQYLQKLDDCIATFISGDTEFEDMLQHVVKYYDFVFSAKQDNIQEIVQESVPHFNLFFDLIGVGLATEDTIDEVMQRTLYTILWGSADKDLFEAVTYLVPETIKSKYNILYWENWLMANRKDYYLETLDRFRPKRIYNIILRR